jgi:hypothetical protein
MIAVLTVMSDMDLSHDYLGYVWFRSDWLTKSRWFGSWHAIGGSLWA